MPGSRTGFLAALLLCCAAFQGGAAALETPTLDFVYIDSTVDMSAGGHSALRLGEAVYHFQLCPGGLFLLMRDPWNEFRYTRNSLGNRSITIHRVPLAQADFSKVESNLLTFYVQQERRLQILRELEKERDLLHRFAAGERWISVEGLGFFDEEARDDSHGVALRRQIDTQLGSRHLRDAFARVNSRLQEVDLQPIDFPIDSPDSPVVWSGGYSEAEELLHLREALRVLLMANPLRLDALLIAETNAGPLTSSEMEAIAALREDILASITALVRTERPGRGKALLLQVARYHAISHTMEDRLLVTLDPFSDAARSRPLSELSGREPSFDLILEECAYDVAAFRAAVANLEGAERRQAYGRLEDSQGRMYELERLVCDGDPVRVEEGYLVPSRGRRMPLTLGLSDDDLSSARTTTKRNAVAYRKHVRASAGYNFLTRNCVTELARLVNGSFRSRGEAEKALGGHIEPGSGLTFIPCRFSKRAGRTYAVEETLDLPSYRLRRLAHLRAEGGYGVWLRENNTITSTIYTPWHADTTFLFFTDDVFWPRPIFGLANTVYALIHTSGGVVMSPFDRGHHLSRGLRGIVFSLPELAFFNIRKGSFQATP